MADVEQLSEPKQLAGYELIAKLADGPMGAVYKAKSHGVEGFEKILVVKVIDPELVETHSFLEILIEEAKRGVNLSHANIAQVYDLGRAEDDNQFYIATEFVDGFDLGRARNLADRASEEWTQALSIFIVSEVAKGLDYAHRRKDFNFNNLNIIHRRLRPSNIMLSFDGEVKVTDFGVAKAFEAVTADSKEELVARHKYSAPEVARDGSYNQRSDLFSLGLIFLELLLGKHPYESSDPAETLKRVRSGRIPAFNEDIDLPRSMQQLLESMLAPDPAGRLGSAGTAYEELVGYLFGNNLKGDNRTLSTLMKKLRRARDEMDPESTAEPDLGTKAVKFSEIEGAFDKDESYTESIDKPLVEDSDDGPKSAVLPADKIQSAIGSTADSELPGILESLYQSVDQGSGKALLISGQLGSGEDYLPDRVVDALDWEDETTTLGIPTTQDDRYVPFGGLSNVIVRCLQSSMEGRQLPDYEAILSYLEGLELSDKAVRAVGELWNRRSLSRIGYGTKTAFLTDVIRAVIEDITRKAPLVLVIDQVEQLDTVSLDVLREVVAVIGDLPVLLVMTTGAPDRIRGAFDLGDPENLEAIQILGKEHPEVDEITDLDDNATDVLTYLAIYEQPLSQSDLKHLTGLEGTDLQDAVVSLVDKGIVRVPARGLFVAGVPNIFSWAERTLSDAQIKETALEIAQYFEAAEQQFRPQSAPLLARLYARASAREQLIAKVEDYGNWLESRGWFDVALSFYDWCDELFTAVRSSAHLRIRYLERRTEIAVQRADVDTVRKSLEPLSAMAETMDNPRAQLRAELFMGSLAMKQDDLVDADKHYSAAQREAEGLEIPDLLVRGLLARGEWAYRLGLLRKNRIALDRAWHIVDRYGYRQFDARVCSEIFYRLVVSSLERGSLTEAKHWEQYLQTLAQKTDLPEVDGRVNLAKLELAYERNDRALHEKIVDASHPLLEGDKLSRLFGRLLELETRVALDDGNYDDVLQAKRLLDQFDGQIGKFYLQVITERSWLARFRTKELPGEECAARLDGALQRAEQRGILRDEYRLNRYLAFVAKNPANYKGRAVELARRMGFRRYRRSESMIA